jgi:hypothetical protein
MKSAKTAIRLARTSQFLGILSVIIPLIAFFIQWIPREETRLWSLLPLLTTWGGVLFGVPGYLAAITARRDYDVIRDDAAMQIVMTGRTVSIIGTVISMLFIVNRLCTGFAY